eukprot:4969047-Prymnesium_polylepis.2
MPSGYSVRTRSRAVSSSSSRSSRLRQRDTLKISDGSFWPTTPSSTFFDLTSFSQSNEATAVLSAIRSTAPSCLYWTSSMRNARSWSAGMFGSDAASWLMNISLGSSAVAWMGVRPARASVKKPGIEPRRRDMSVGFDWWKAR